MMRNILEKINVSWDDSIKAVVTDKPTSGNVGLEGRAVAIISMILGVLLAIFSVMLFLMVMHYNTFMAPLIVLLGGEPPSADRIVFELIGIVILSGISVSIFIFGLTQLDQKATWYVVLYPDYMVIKYREKGKFVEKKVSLSTIHACFIIPTRKASLQLSKTKPRMRFEFSVNIHLEYKEDDEMHYLSMPLASQYKQINKLILHLQKMQHIPIYYTHIRMTRKESTQPVTSLDPVNFEMIEFNGDLKEYVRS